jgi:murein DD-endopeptidase MepM/ murein hydrolase activator NlpD
VNNNGLDFLTSVNAEVKSVFSGKVTSVFNIPGAGYNIIITHGTYKTVYSGLSSSNVSVGGQVSAGQVLGNVIDSGDGYILHFELWRINESGVGAPQNPELWIKRR